MKFLVTHGKKRHLAVQFDTNEKKGELLSLHETLDYSENPEQEGLTTASDLNNLILGGVSVACPYHPNERTALQNIYPITTPPTPIPGFVPTPANFCNNPNNIRRPDWIDYHPRNPTSVVDSFPTNPYSRTARILRNGGLDSLNHGGNDHNYVFGFYESLSLPIRIRVIEASPWAPPNQAWRNVFFETVQVRIGWFDTNFTGAADQYQILFSDPPYLTLNNIGSVGGSRNDLTISITAADIVPGSINGPIHWIAIRDVINDTGPAGQILENGNGADISIQVCSAPGMPLEIIQKAPVYIVLIIDVSGSTLSGSTKANTRKQKIISDLNALIDSGELSSNYKYAIRLFGACGSWDEGTDQFVEVGRDTEFDQNKYRAYEGDGFFDKSETEKNIPYRTNTSSLLSFSNSINDNGNEVGRIEVVKKRILAALDRNELALSPVWRSISELVDDFSETGKEKDEAVFLSVLFSDGEDTVGGEIKDGVGIITRNEASIKVHQQENPTDDTIYSPTNLPASPVSNEAIEKRNENISKIITKEVKDEIDSIATTTSLSSFQYRMNLLKTKYNISGQFLITKPDLAADHPLSYSLGGSSIDLSTEIDEKLKPITKRIEINARWCHNNCRT